MPDAPEEQQVDAIRRFNRYYTRRIGALGEGQLDSPFSLAELRVLYELAHRDRPSASEIAADLAMDAGYLSRILTRFSRAGYVTKVASARDGRSRDLVLTDAGRAAFEPLEQATIREIGAMIAPLGDSERRRLVAAMDEIERLLDGDGRDPVPYVLRPPRPGDMGWIVHRQAVLYAREYGWDDQFEALIAEITSKFVTEFDARRERCWVAERYGEILGAVFVVRVSDEEAKLRLLYVEPAARGLGIGRRLVEECLRFARDVGYSRMTLWTNDILTAARHIYSTLGFRLVSTEAHHSFGKDLVGEYWEIDL